MILDIKQQADSKLETTQPSLKQDSQLNETMLQIKLKLADIIIQKVEQSEHSQHYLSKELGITQPQLSKIVCRKVACFTADMLMKIVMKCGLQVSVNIL